MGWITNQRYWPIFWSKNLSQVIRFCYFFECFYDGIGCLPVLSFYLCHLLLNCAVFVSLGLLGHNFHVIYRRVLLHEELAQFVGVLPHFFPQVGDLGREGCQICVELLVETYSGLAQFLGCITFTSTVSRWFFALPVCSPIVLSKILLMKLQISI